MKKIPTLFKRDFEKEKRIVYNEITPGLEECLKTGIATLKIDGTAVAIIDGKFYKRYDANTKYNKVPPIDAIKCIPEPDPITGHLPCWVPVKDIPDDKWFRKAFDYYKENNEIKDGTYELIGRHFQGNPYELTYDTLIPHGSVIISDFPRDFDGMKKYFKNHKIEGVVFWDKNMKEPKCKIKRSDFGYSWNTFKGVD